MRRFLAVVLFGSAALAQQANPKPDLLSLTDELDAAIQSGDWNKAVELSKSLKEATVVARDQSMAKGGAELADQILTWLPADTETLVVAQQPFKIPEANSQIPPSAIAGAQTYILGPIGAAEEGKVLEALLGRTIRLTAIGARKFQNHEARGSRNALPLGMIAYQGCAVYSLIEEVPESIFQRSADESVMGHPVWISKGSQNDDKDTDTYLLALPRPDLMLACNDRDFFTQMVSRMAASQAPRALPADLPEWKQLDRSAPVWAIRHFRADRAKTDPTLAEIVQGSGGKNLEVTGLTVEFGLKSASAKAQMIAKSNPWEELEKSPESQGAKSQKISDGVWELSFPNTPESGFFAVFALMGFLGFAVLV